MAGFEVSVVIAGKTPEEVFDFTTDPASATRVTSNVRSLELVTPAPMQAGSRLREVRVVNGKEATAELEVRAYERPSRYVVGVFQEGIDVEYTFVCRPEAGGTRVDLSCTVEGRGLKRVMAPLVAGLMKREDGDHLERLKAAMTGSL